MPSTIYSTPPDPPWFRGIPIVSKRLAFHIVLCALLVGPAWAHVDSPQATEKSLRSAVEATFKSFSDLHAVLGLRPQMTADAEQAACVTTRSCTLAAALKKLQLSALDLRDESQGFQRDDTRLGGSFGATATEAMRAAIRAATDLTRSGRELDSLRSGKALAKKAPELASAAPELQPAVGRVFEALRALLDYLNFSGVPTQDLQASLAGMTPKTS